MLTSVYKIYIISISVEGSGMNGETTVRQRAAAALKLSSCSNQKPYGNGMPQKLRQVFAISMALCR